MKINDLEQLEYLHDAIVSEVAFVYKGNSKAIKIITICDSDCGYRDWSGKAVTVTLSNVLRASGVVLGHIAGQDIINSFSEGASEDMQRSIQVMCDIGIFAPKIFLRLAFHSGSEIEIACDEIDVRVD